MCNESDDILLEELFEREWMPVRTFNICKDVNNAALHVCNFVYQTS